MYPTRVPTYSTEIGTSRSTTGSTFTTAAGGDALARDASRHPAAVIPTSPSSETTSSPRMSIMRLLLSSGAEGKRIHSPTSAQLASPIRFLSSTAVSPSAGGLPTKARTIDDIAACPPLDPFGCNDPRIHGPAHVVG